jgi:hypothetical protein
MAGVNINHVGNNAASTNNAFVGIWAGGVLRWGNIWAWIMIRKGMDDEPKAYA